MVRILLLIIFFNCCWFEQAKSYSQKTGKEGFIQIKVPRSERKDVVSLAKYLTQGINGDSMKVVVLSSWIVTNIKYDYRVLKSGHWEKRSTKKILKKRKALCGGFSELFNELCLESGISSEEVIG